MRSSSLKTEEHYAEITNPYFLDVNKKLEESFSSMCELKDTIERKMATKNLIYSNK